MSSMLGGLMGGMGGGGGMMGGMMGGGGGGGGAMGALSNLAQVGGEINKTKAAAEGGGSIMNSGGSNNPSTDDPEMSALKDLLNKYAPKKSQATAVNYGPGVPSKGLNTPDMM